MVPLYALAEVPAILIEACGLLDLNPDFHLLRLQGAGHFDGGAHRATHLLPSVVEVTLDFLEGALVP